MTGKYDIILYNNKLHYQLTVKRNITVLRGDSASGKSELLRLLGTYKGNPTSSGITLMCDRECDVLNEGNWKLYTSAYQGHIFFIDEGNAFLRTKEFADTVRGADNYFVIVSREKLSQLPYSIDEIYGLREGDRAGKYHNLKRVYNEMYRIYGALPDSANVPEIIVTEDSNSGNEFFGILFPGRCISANGKSNIKRVVVQHKGQKILAVVDGAAFGPEIQGCMELVSGLGAGQGAISIFAPESFEYLILQSGVLEVPASVVEETWEYADSVRFFSWEEFYTHYLSDVTRNGIGQYSKHRLGDFYKTAGNVDRISKMLPEFIRDILERKQVG